MIVAETALQLLHAIDVKTLIEENLLSVGVMNLT
jgi:hypothetical protein